MSTHPHQPISTPAQSSAISCTRHNYSPAHVQRVWLTQLQLCHAFSPPVAARWLAMPACSTGVLYSCVCPQRSCIHMFPLSRHHLQAEHQCYFPRPVFYHMPSIADSLISPTPIILSPKHRHAPRHISLPTAATRSTRSHDWCFWTSLLLPHPHSPPCDLA